VKKELRDDDAVASEDAGHAYIGESRQARLLLHTNLITLALTENFALKVFSLADGEDQGGNSTR